MFEVVAVFGIHCSCHRQGENGRSASKAFPCQISS